jgi:hypothetical protein
MDELRDRHLIYGDTDPLLVASCSSLHSAHHAVPQVLGLEVPHHLYFTFKFSFFGR